MTDILALLQSIALLVLEKLNRQGSEPVFFMLVTPECPPGLDSAFAFDCYNKTGVQEMDHVYSYCI
jgi:hypothetical protein